MPRSEFVELMILVKNVFNCAKLVIVSKSSQTLAFQREHPAILIIGKQVFWI